jgi:four helix bundle protein
VDFLKLTVWKRAKDLAVFIYGVTNENGFDRDLGLKDQIRRAAVSISSNIAEGDELNTNKQAINHFYIAKGSSAEVYNQAIIACEVGYINADTLNHIKGECSAISKMLYSLIRSRSETS